MTHILAIEGTGMRLEIEKCRDCPCFNADVAESLNSGCNLDVVSVDDGNSNCPPPFDCPLPEKTPPDEECAGFRHIVDVRHQYGGVVVQFAPTEHETHSVLLTESCARELLSLLGRTLKASFAIPL